MGVALRISFRDLDQLADRLAVLDRLEEPVLDSVGALVESQTKARIAAGGPAPDGTPWKEWSKAYARTRHAGQSLLRSQGYLFDSITHQVVPGAVEVGSSRVYARIQQMGGQVVHKARAGTLRLRTTGSRGRLLRQGKTGRLANLAVFARMGGPNPHVNFTERLFQAAEYTITMPARPYLGVSDQDEADIGDLVLDILKRSLP